MIPKGVYIFGIVIILRWVALLIFINSKQDGYMWIYILSLIPMIYLILAVIFPKLDKFKLFTRKPTK